MPALSTDPARRAAEEKILADVEESGLHVRRIKGDEEYPEFAYTVGLARGTGQAEVIVVGLPADVAQELLNRVADLVDEGRRFVAGDRATDIADGFPVEFRAVTAKQGEAHLRWAHWLHGDAPFDIVQLVYPDRHGRWPWDPATDSAFRWQQPLLDAKKLPAWAR